MPTNTFSRSLKGRILLTLPYYGFVLISFLIDRLFFHVVDPFNLLVVLGTAVALNVVICWVPLPQYVTVFIFLLFAQYGGMMLNLYDNVSWYDVVVHLGSGVMLVYIGQYLYSLILRRRRGGRSAAHIAGGVQFLFLHRLCRAVGDL